MLRTKNNARRVPVTRKRRASRERPLLASVAWPFAGWRLRCSRSDRWVLTLVIDCAVLNRDDVVRRKAILVVITTVHSDGAPFETDVRHCLRRFHRVIGPGFTLDDSHPVIAFVAIGDRHRVGCGGAQQEPDHTYRTRHTHHRTELKGCTSSLLLLLLRGLLRGLLRSLLLSSHCCSPSSDSPESCSGSVNVKIFLRVYN